MDAEYLPTEEEAPAVTQPPALPPPEAAAPPPDGPEQPTPDQKKQQTRVVATIVAIVVVVILVMGGFAAFLLSPGTDTAKIRDVFIIFMAIQSMLIGLALIILMVQLAQLIVLLRNDIKPILDTTSETVNTLRGTVVFLGDNLAEPVMKLNEMLAALNQFRRLFRWK